MPAWRPGVDPWPGTTGGAGSPNWGPYIRLYVRAAIGAGNTFHVGAHTFDRLDAGNVLGGGVPAPGGDLWSDMSCDITELQVTSGATSSQGIFSKPDAATVTVNILDPDAKYDPLNWTSPFAYGGHSRLIPGTPIEVFAEVVTPADSTITRHWLFTGTADSWGEDWTPHRNERTAQLVASDATKILARMDQPEQPSTGAGDTVTQRVDRIVTAFGWGGTVEHDPAGGTVTLQATTLAQPAWELLNRTLDDELGYVYLTATNSLRWVNRATWTTRPAWAIVLGCVPGGHDILIDAAPSTIDRQIRNRVDATRTGGVNQSARSDVSIERFGMYGYNRTDLGLADDSQAATWATRVVELYAYPQVSLAGIVMVPAVAADTVAAYRQILSIRYVSDIARIFWSPPDIAEYTVDLLSRVVGVDHRIDRARWETTWQLVQGSTLANAGITFHIGAHANDRLNSNFVLAA
jgi:hypothetical protein